MLKSRSIRIVVADDEEINLFILKKNLHDNGYITKGFDSGMATWEYLQKNPYSADIVVLDKMMGDLNGVEIIKLMKQHPILKHVPVLMQSGCADMKEALNAGADRYLVKPFSAQEIMEAVEELSASIDDNTKRILIKA